MSGRRRVPAHSCHPLSMEHTVSDCLCGAFYSEGQRSAVLLRAFTHFERMENFGVKSNPSLPAQTVHHRTRGAAHLRSNKTNGSDCMAADAALSRTKWAACRVHYAQGSRQVRDTSRN